MQYVLTVAEPAYSSWSLRGWLCLRLTAAPHTTRWIEMYGAPPLVEKIGHSPARTIPVLSCPDGPVVRDSLAIAEELAQRHPDAVLWPDDPTLRALARSLAAEMHSGFGALRDACPMNLRQAWRMATVSEAIRADLDRLDVIFADALARSGGPWLAGDYSAADAFYAPVCARLAGYSLPVSETLRAYVRQSLLHPLITEWRDMAAKIGPDRHSAPDAPYWQDLPKADWDAIIG